MTVTAQDSASFSLIRRDSMGAYRRCMEPHTGRETMGPSHTEPPAKPVTEQQ